MIKTNRVYKNQIDRTRERERVREKKNEKE